MIIALWLFAIVGANLSIAHFGPGVSILNAFFLIGLSLTTRDHLHRRWDGHHLKPKMGLLIATGGLLSWITQPATGQIALASIIAFTLAEIVDSIVFHYTRSINKSNTVSAFVDSVLFPTIAFGGFPILIILGQWFAKVGGGAVWALVLQKRRWVGLLALLGVTSAQAQNLQIHQNEHGQYLTAEVFVPGEIETYAFIDQYLYGPEVVYGEVAIYKKMGDFAATVQLEAGDALYFDIPEVLLAGVRWNGFEILARSDDQVQFTYVWFWRKGNWQLNGYIDVWGMDEWFAVAQPQLWFWLSDHIAIGGEVFSDIKSEKYTPSFALKINF